MLIIFITPTIIPYTTHKQELGIIKIIMVSVSDRAISTSLRPHINDVICGRGKGAYRHQGNVAYRQLVKSYKVI